MHTGKANPRRRSGRDRLWRRVRALGEPCWICGLPIPLDAPARDPLSFELDELLPVSSGGSPTDPGNVAGTHRCCNLWRGVKSISHVERVRSMVRARYGSWPSPIVFVRCAKSIDMKDGAPVMHPVRSSGAV